MFAGYPDVALAEYVVPTEEIPARFLPDSETGTNDWLLRDDVDRSAEVDFVLLAEFCESIGPKLVMTVPLDIWSGINLNELTIRLMSVDFNFTNCGPCLLPEDAQMTLSDSRQKFHLLAHYFALRDSNARGYIRPFCIAFITKCERKVFLNFREISGMLDKICRRLRVLNLSTFYNDMLPNLPLPKVALELNRGNSGDKINQATDSDDVPGVDCLLDLISGDLLKVLADCPQRRNKDFPAELRNIDLLCGQSIGTTVELIAKTLDNFVQHSSGDSNTSLLYSHTSPPANIV